MGVKVTGQFEPAGDFSIVDGKDVEGNITGSNVSASGQLEAGSLGTNLASIISGSTPFGASDVSGSWRGEFSSSNMTFVGGGVTGSSSSTGSFGRVLSETLNTTGNADIGGNLTITGNYTVNGTTTFISSSQLDIGDNIIHLNSVSPVRYAGIHVRDIISTTNTGSMVWDATNDYWLAGQSGSEYRVPLQDSTSNLTDNTIVIAQGNGRLESGNITDNGSNITMSLPVTASSNLEVVGNVSGSATSTGSFGHLVLDNRDTDAIFEFGRAHIGHIGFSDMAGFSHVDHDGTGTFALAQSSAGKTIVQAASGQPIAFKIGGSDKVQINSSGDLGIGIETALHKLHVIGDAVITGNVSGSLTSTGSFGRLGIRQPTPHSNNDADAFIHIGNASHDKSSIVFEQDGSTGGNEWEILAHDELQFRRGTTQLMYFGTDNDARFRYDLLVDGNITGSSNLEIAGNVSGSSTSTGSFGRVSTTTGIVGAGGVSQTARTNADDLVINNSTTDGVGISILGSDSYYKSINFGGANSNRDAVISYSSTSDNKMTIGTTRASGIINFVTGNGDESFRISGGTSGIISGSSISTGSFGRVETAGALNVNGFTTLGNGISSNGGNFTISTSATEPALDIKANGVTTIKLRTGANSYISTGNDNTAFMLGTTGNQAAKFAIYAPTTSVHKYGMHIIDQNGSTFAVDIAGNVTASGHISASGTIYADNFQSAGGDSAGISFTDDFVLTGNMTASGDISGSSTSTGSFGRLESNTFNTTTFNSTTVTSTTLNVTGEITGSSLDISGNMTGSGNLEIAGNISGSSITTGSFGRVIVDDVIIDNGDVTIPATKKLYLDGGNDTYITEGSSNQIQFFTNGNLGFGQDATGHVFIQATDAFYYDGGSNTFRKEKSADVLVDTVGGVETLTLTTTAISGSSITTGSFGQLEIGNGGDIILTEDQRIYFEADKGTWIESSMSDSFRMVAGGSQMLLLDYDTGNRAVFGNGTKVYIGADNNKQPDKELVVDGDISGSSTSTGSFGHLKLGNVDTDASFEFGRAHIGHIGYSDMAGFSHVDLDAATTFALAQNSSGKTIINASSGQPIAFKIGNSDKVQINSSGDLGIGIETALHKLHVVGNAFFTGNISGSAASTGSFGAGFIDNKLGIGTSSPETNLHLGTSKTFKLGTGNTNTTSLMDIVANSGTYAFQVWDDNSLSTPRFSIERTGKVGIGKDAQYGLLDVAGTIQALGIQVYQTGSFHWDMNSGGATEIFMTNKDSGNFTLKVGGNVTISATNKLYLDGGGNTYFYESSADNIKATVGGTDVLDITTTKISGSSSSTGSFGHLTVGPSNGTEGLVFNPLGSPNNTLSIYASNGENRFSFRADAAGGDARQIMYNNAETSMIDLNTGAGILLGAGMYVSGSSTSTATFGNYGGNISGSSTSTGSFGKGFIGERLKVGGDTTSTFPGGSDYSSSLAVVDINVETVSGGSLGEYQHKIPAINIVRNISNAEGQNGEGSIIDFFQDNASHRIYRSGRFESITTDVTNSSEDSEFRLHTSVDGTLTEQLYLGGNKISGSSVSTGSFGRLEIDGIVSASGYQGQIGSRYVHSQTSDSETWNIQHNLGHKYPVATIYDSSDRMILPESATASDSDNFVLTFNEAIQGTAILSIGGVGNNAGNNYIHTQSDSSTNWRVTHSLSQQYPNVTVFDDNNEVILPETITATSENHADIVFSSGKSGYANFSIGSGIPNISSGNAGKFLKVRADGEGVEWVVTTANVSGSMSVSGSITPDADDTYDLGSSSKRWANLYTGDVQLSNEGSEGNEVDGTTGSWTIQEGEDDLYLLNRKNGKKYRFKLEEIT